MHYNSGSLTKNDKKKWGVVCLNQLILTYQLLSCRGWGNIHGKCMRGGGPIQYGGILSYGICSDEGILASVSICLEVLLFLARSSFYLLNCSTTAGAKGLPASSRAVLAMDVILIVQLVPECSEFQADNFFMPL